MRKIYARYIKKHAAGPELCSATHPLEALEEGLRQVLAARQLGQHRCRQLLRVAHKHRLRAGQAQCWTYHKPGHSNLSPQLHLVSNLVYMSDVVLRGCVQGSKQQPDQLSTVVSGTCGLQEHTLPVGLSSCRAIIEAGSSACAA